MMKKYMTMGTFTKGKELEGDSAGVIPGFYAKTEYSSYA
jgi:hypothetical protein